MKIQLTQKQGTHLGAPLEVSGPVPRVGETICTEENVGYTQGEKCFLVVDVTYQLANGDLEAHVLAKANSSASLRHHMLQIEGWLERDDGLPHDS